MSFPISPSNNATTIVNGITYIYNTSLQAWKIVPGNATDPFARTTANTAATNATTADSKAVTAGSYANSAYAQANTATTNADSAFLRANTPTHVANSAALYANGAFLQANSAFTSSNNKLDLTIGGTVVGPVTFQETLDVLQTGTVSATTSYDMSVGNVFYHSSVAAAANWTANFTNVPTTDNRTSVASIIVAQGATAYIPNAVQIGGVSQTINWIGGTAPTGGSNKRDIFSFSLIRTGAAWIVLGQSASYG
jgi:hypothetical protein